MFNFCSNKIQLVLYFTTLSTMIMGVSYVCIGSFIFREFFPLLPVPGIFKNQLWGLLYVHLIATGVYTILVGCIGLSGIDKYLSGQICLHRVLILLLIALHGLAIFAFVKDAGKNREQFNSYLSKSIRQVLEADGVQAAKENEQVWNYFEAALNCKRIYNNCAAEDAVSHVMLRYYMFVAYLGVAGGIFVVDLALTFIL